MSRGPAYVVMTSVVQTVDVTVSTEQVDEACHPPLDVVVAVVVWPPYAGGV